MFGLGNTSRVAKIFNLRIDAKVALRGWLIQNNRTQVWLASQLGIDETLLSRMLAGYRPMPDEIATAIRRITGINVRQFAEVA